MPIHDWTRVSAGTWHDMHVGWIAELRTVLNGGLLPEGYYAQAEQIGERVTDFKRNSVVIRHSDDDRIISLIAITSPADKSTRSRVESTTKQARFYLEQGLHLLLVDLFPETEQDPFGLNAVIWEALRGEKSHLSERGLLSIASYDAGSPVELYLEPIAVGQPLIDMPLFLAPRQCTVIPLEATYAAAYRGVPAKYKRELEA